MTIKKIYWALISTVAFGLMPLAWAQQNIISSQSETNSSVESSANSSKLVRVNIEFSAFVNSIAPGGTTILVDKNPVCKNQNITNICSFQITPGKHEITLNTHIDTGTFTEKYDFELGKIYTFDVVTDYGNVALDLFIPIPFASAIFSKKGSDAGIKLKLVSAKQEGE
jgi:hypothetical protein